MKKCLTTILLLFLITTKAQVTKDFNIDNTEFLVKLPNYWKLDNSIFYNDKNKKVGEIGQGLTEFLSGENFIKTLKKGFDDDKPTTSFIKGDTIVINNTKWFYALRKGEWEDGKGNAGFWYDHNFMRHCNSKSFQFILYNYTGNLDNWMEKIIDEFECK
jgi:hypothetical protein